MIVVVGVYEYSKIQSFSGELYGSKNDIQQQPIACT
jgi:hypothetical protein